MSYLLFALKLATFCQTSSVRVVLCLVDMFTMLVTALYISSASITLFEHGSEQSIDVIGSQILLVPHYLTTLMFSAC